MNITCQEICDQFDISLYDLLDFNRHNDNFLSFPSGWFMDGDTFCVSKPNFTAWDNCVSLAQLDQNNDMVDNSMLMEETYTISPLASDSSITERYEYFYDTSLSSYTTRAIDASLEVGQASDQESEFLLETNQSDVFDTRSTSSTASSTTSATRSSSAASITSIPSASSSVTTSPDSETTVSRGDAASLKMFGIAFVITFVSCLL